MQAQLVDVGTLQCRRAAIVYKWRWRITPCGHTRDGPSEPTDRGSRSKITIFRGISKCCDILDTLFGKHDNTTTLGTLLASLITQSKEIAHVLGSPAG